VRRGCALTAAPVDVRGEIRRLLIYLKRKAREKLPKECYEKVKALIEDLEAKLDEYDYDEALRRWE